MDCNKEEAIRAKAIAEKKMESKDFVGARKIGVKAQQLYPDLENISQMLMVCEVHCSAEQKLFGNEMDWYGILQIDQKADELTIKKQFRKFALQLHPDKNKFSGAEAAFKLIGEAQTVLLNRDKRNMHDMKHRASVGKTVGQHQPRTKASWNSNVHLRNNFSGMNPQNQQQQQPTQPGNAQSTFWTMCPFCMVKYQYYRTTALHKSLTCQSCKKPFIAYETNMQAPPNSLNQQAYPQKNYGFSKVEMRCQGNVTAENPKSESFQKNGQKAGFSIRRSEKMNQKRDRKPVVESSECSDSASSTDSEEDVVIDKDAVPQQYYGEQQPRRSSRSKQQVSYKENVSDDDDDIPIAKRGKRSGSSCATEEENEDASKEEESKMSNQSDPVTKTKGDEDKAKQNEGACFEEPSKVQAKKMQNVIDGKRSLERNEKVHESSPADTSFHEKIEAEPMYSFPRNDFSDFEKMRTEVCFKVGQLWALYDSQNGMPRFYARIKKLYSVRFKAQITWLEAAPDDDNGKKWANADLPISCGKFSQGQSEITEDILMFSHLISWEKIKNTYKIYPRKGETWAIFKNWDLNWYSDLDSNFKRKFEYEYIEILSEYAEGVGMCVALLEKVKGFVSVFCQMVEEGKGTFQVPPGELLRFSHRVPSFKLTGDEGLGVPSGSVELDPASILFTDKEIETREKKTNTSGLFSKSSNIMKPVPVCDGNVATHQGDPKIINLEAEHDKSNFDAEFYEDHDAHEVSSPGGIEVPDPEFYNFDADKSLEKFQIGQIWALYSDEDGLPKYYGWIKKIDSSKSKLKILVAWLESSSLPDNLIEWHDKEMPICCGRFVVKRNEFQDYDCTNTFSHLVRALRVGRNEFDIFPRRGEVWALYKHWTPDISSSGLGTCEYDVVEVCEDNDLQRKVLILERVDGFNSVFRVGGSAETMTISEAELLRFSHSIPSFRLTEERGGSLRGFWELDPAALPVRYFSSQN